MLFRSPTADSGIEARLAPELASASRPRSAPGLLSASGQGSDLHAVAELCPSLAIRVAGIKMSADEIITEVLKDEVFFRNSGGGVTFSGGEPLMQATLLLELVQAFTRLGLDCAVETCLAVSPAILKPFLDLPLTWLTDLKHTDVSVFREGTGGDLSVVLTNLESLADAGARMIFRVPVIPGFNDNDKAITGILDRKSVV